MMSLQEAAQVLSATLAGGRHDRMVAGKIDFTGVSTDSRALARGELFVALVGPNFDGHDFIVQARDRGAMGALVQQDRLTGDQEYGIPLIRVQNTRLALGQLAAYWRARFTIPLVAVTGSNGKTTVKEMIASILRRAAEQAPEEMRTDAPDAVLATQGNLNNDIGMPLTLLRLRERHHYAVIEMGMNHPGEISYLSRLAKPSVALITNAGDAHIQGLGSVEAVARAKGEIFEGLDQQGIAVINADDPHNRLWRELAGNRQIIDFGLKSKAKVSADYKLTFSGAQITLILPQGVEETTLQVPGEHNVRNALAAAAVAVAVGVSLKTIASGLSTFGGVKGRMQRKCGVRGATLIDDCYNANPDSVRAALAVLARAEGKKVLVLGDMGELGDKGREFHEQIGDEARIAGIDELMALGDLSAYAAEKFGIGARHFRKMEDLLANIETLPGPDVTLLIKGSRFMQMERVVKRLEAGL
ncbi:UDP-N-acetylmuramoyl-tripeptide--D-alanyl-D-alanine ligase [Nitrosospira multiformis]|uniref:UDP-N-acetylmuramoyl-tripeptide--D-alanyl-D-alanine ligase n=2 Tax=Nitrosospira multiformis (strain ATCC 25196 / NCIMB 11849 / C 71) TaxID=323848 RepID=A0A1H5TUU9_NITMU|nr:UDP-N-acetylmuramoyl-tripeptide--D-alanyl-D-alanine ligase [Nitrosospira multiformis]SEA14126.1 UDP-N-acetylmuramoyl-tripeptide--D-alanyl-D-alanine ligase [Nitrosospira multiformis]SEF66540.1 UDP-N-acetylmuramoyl-tripeptide--D-alanyl-D-alanine ligase [Nitrosospira multiformis ATCC 25196]